MIEGGDAIGEVPSFGWQKEERAEMWSSNSPGLLLAEEQWDLVGNSYAFGKREFLQQENIKQ